ncbi:CarD family transcriptional regulator [Microvirga tunisiensis]|uniref:CarD family transcriptional regulator n=1 Tax=Microvirga tunisiensis TaxID=2108360 RepID=A0A5N7MCI9_9HYPH|nr:CarD family transcriptional regulator [Microvirga tunisiensis]MPR05614.1 CarD family transcriptional regulator [Microvirga tunisiensis]MPR23814.1 CarD family transcriptional regulator [Microvirga tunisiensis]
MSTAKKSANPSFTTGETVVYPAHGVGQITAIEDQEVAGFKLQVFVVYFAKEKLTLRVPMGKAAAMRKLSGSETVDQAIEVLGGRPRPKRGMWNRRATEYQEKIATGKLIPIAEVVRDLYRGPNQEDASFSERRIYETGIDFMARELASIKGMTEAESLKLIEQELAKSPRTASDVKAAEDDAEGEADAA